MISSKILSNRILLPSLHQKGTPLRKLALTNRYRALINRRSETSRLTSQPQKVVLTLYCISNWGLKFESVAAKYRDAMF